MRLTDFISDVGKPIAFYPMLRKITGSINATLFICQLIYWDGKQRDQEGWIYKTSDDIEEETSLTYEEQRTARKKLVERGFIQEKYKRLDHIISFRIVHEMINDAWENLGSTRENPCSGSGDCRPHEGGNTLPADEGFPLSLNELENTTENTAEREAPDNFHSKRALKQASAIKEYDFNNMSVNQISRVPEISIYRAVTGRFPGRPQWGIIFRALKKLGYTEMELTQYWEAWISRGYRSESLEWLTEWAVSGNIPARGNKPRDRNAEDDLAQRRKLIFGR